MLLQFVNLLIPNSIIYSIDSSDVQISSEAEAIIKYFNKTHNSLLIGNSNLTSVKIDKLNVDKNYPIFVNIPQENGEYSSERIEMIMTLKDGSILKTPNIRMEYQNNKNIISSINYDYLSKKSDKSDVIVSCLLSQTNFTILSNFNEINEKDKITKIQQLYYVTFVLKNKKMHYIDNDQYNLTLNLIQNDDKNENINDNNFDDFFLFKNSFLNTSFLATISKDVNNNNDIYLYKIDFLSKENIEFSLTLVGKLDNVFGQSKILKVNMYKKNLIISSEYQGLKMLTFLNNNSFAEEILIEYPLNILDFIVYQDAIFAVAEKKGLYIINMKMMNKKIFYKHSFMKKIDIFLNPFTGVLFLGVLIEQQSENHEFFMEYMIKDDYSLRINKIFQSKTKKVFLDFISFDNFYSYFLDVFTNQIYIIRRGMFNSIPFQTYSLPPVSNDEILHFFSFYNKTSNHNNFAFATENSIINTYNYTLPNQNLNCTFSQTGYYLMRFIYLIDSCYPSLNSGKQFPVCQKMLDLQFNILGNSSGKAKSITIGLSVFFFSSLFIVIIVTLLYITKCFKNNKLKVIAGINIDNRKKLYEEESLQLNEDYLENEERKPKEETNTERIKIGRNSSLSSFNNTNREDRFHSQG